MTGGQDSRDAATAAQPAGGAPTTSDPNNRQNLARRLLADDRPREAVAAIESALRDLTETSGTIAFQLLMDKGRAHRVLKELDNAIDAFAAAISIRPDDEDALEQVILTLLTARRLAEARAYQAQLHAIQARRLPHRLADGLAAIWQRTQDIHLDEPAVTWAWELADKSIWQRDAWQAAAAWGKEARLLLRRWWETAPARQLGQLGELVEPPDWSGLRAAVVEGNACVLVGAHVGPTAAGVNMLQGGNWPFRTIGTGDRNRASGETLLPVMANSIAAMRSVVNQIKNGTTIGLLADTPVARERLAIEFLGRNVELPLQIPKLIQRYDTPSFWCCPLWRNGRITIEMKRLPDPLKDEPHGMWSRRWFAAYLAKLEPVMRGRPENLGLFSGIWGNVNEAILRERRKHNTGRRLGKADSSAMPSRLGS